MTLENCLAVSTEAEFRPILCPSNSTAKYTFNSNAYIYSPKTRPNMFIAKVFIMVRKREMLKFHQK